MRGRRAGLSGLVAMLVTAVALTIAMAGGAAAKPPRAHAAYAQQCPQPSSAVRDPSNPLMLPNPPGPDPLNGARFFHDGPHHGAVAKAIEGLLGIDPNDFPESYSWSQFQYDLDQGVLHSMVTANSTIAYQVHELEKIASQPEAERISLYSYGGTVGGTFAQTQKIECSLLKADPGSVPIWNTFLIYQAGYCETRSKILANRPNFERQVNEFAEGIGNRPAVTLVELDAIGSGRCMEKNGGLGAWEADLRYEMNKLQSLPHTVVYIEAGYSDGNPPGWTARALEAVHVERIRGFFTNDTHSAWTINELRWGRAILKLLARKGIHSHFVVNTAGNGRGPDVPKSRVKSGNEVLCNPPGLGIGIRPTTNTAYTGFANVDAFLWAGTAGNSSGSCNGGPPVGSYWTPRGVDMASRANEQLGPGYPSRPY